MDSFSWIDLLAFGRSIRWLKDKCASLSPSAAVSSNNVLN